MKKPQTLMAATLATAFTATLSADPPVAAPALGIVRVAPANAAAVQHQLKQVEVQIAALRNFMARADLTQPLNAAYQQKLKQLEASRDQLRRHLGLPIGDVKIGDVPRQQGHPAPNGKRFPAHWGAPPRRQTKDLRKLPGNYGRGSGTLAKWIQQNIDRDKAAAKNNPKQNKPGNKPNNKKEKKFTVAQVNAVRVAANFDRHAMSLPGIIGVGTGGRNGNDAWINVMARDKNCMANAQKQVGKHLNGVPIKFQVVGQIKAQPPRLLGPPLRQPVPPNLGRPVGRKAFPAHWGRPPQIQTRDLRQLPGGYGRGSSTLARWIQSNLDRDAKKGVKPNATDNAAQIQQLQARVTQINNFLKIARLSKPAYDKLVAEVKMLEKKIADLKAKGGKPQAKRPAVSAAFAAKHRPGTYAPGELLVGVRKGVAKAQIDKELNKALPGHVVVKSLVNNTVLHMRLPASMNVEQGMAALKGSPCVRYSELNGIATIQRPIRPGGIPRILPIQPKR